MTFTFFERARRYSPIRNEQRKMLLACLTIVLSVLNCAWVNGQIANDQPALVSAVAPNYSATALYTHTSGEVVVEVKINLEGSVISAEGISGSPLLIGGSKFAALRWKFASASKTVRTVRLTFSYHLAARDTPAEDLVAVFKPPYHVEITHVLPDEPPEP
jgi:hypothetical protein